MNAFCASVNFDAFIGFRSSPSQGFDAENSNQDLGRFRGSHQTRTELTYRRGLQGEQVTGETEFGFHEFTTSLASRHDRWTNRDFVRHYYYGGGRAVTLLEIGHLREIAEQYANGDGTEGAFRRLADQIADAARASGVGALSYDFGAPYDFGDVAFSHGDGVVRGNFVGRVDDRGTMLRITGETIFEFSDIFEDPLDIGIEAGGTPYPITGNWTARFSAEVTKDAARSEYGAVGGR
jgi:hypothetical protein